MQHSSLTWLPPHCFDILPFIIFSFLVITLDFALYLLYILYVLCRDSSVASPGDFSACRLMVNLPSVTVGHNHMTLYGA